MNPAPPLARVAFVVATIAAATAVTACGKAMIGETQLIHAPARSADCQLALVQADITAYSFNQTWEVLGYVTLSDYEAQDPAAAENRALVRPRACRMGGTSIAVTANATTRDALGRTGSGVSYMVLRPKTAAAAPTTF
ncbi:MAG: hypothetical protein H0X17_03965 [Deltaproteobacteria bacterium]|nr:hypothetical protein [Deltaproteobacteria bacterium]